MELKELEERILRVIDKSHFTAVLTVNSSENDPRMRLMDGYRGEGYDIWFITNKESRKVGQIEYSPKVELIFAPEGFIEFVRRKGEFQFFSDIETKKIMWPKVKDVTARFLGFSGPEDETLTCIKFIPLYIIYIDHRIAKPNEKSYHSLKFENGEKIFKSFMGVK